jgi:hypothetical protein
LFPREDETDLIHLDPLLLLQRLFYGKNLVFGLEVEGLLTPRERFNEDLYGYCSNNDDANQCDFEWASGQ